MSFNCFQAFWKVIPEKLVFPVFLNQRLNTLHCVSVDMVIGSKKGDATNSCDDKSQNKISWSMIIIECMLATSGWWLLVLMRSRCLGIFGRITEIASYCSPWLTINTNSQHSTRWNATFINSCHIKQSNKNRDLPWNKISFPLTHTSFWLSGQNLTEKTRFQSWPNIEVYLQCRLHQGEIC